MNNTVQKVLSDILNSFKSGDIPKAVALASYPVPNIPSTNWSFINLTIMYSSGTIDARGFRQWKEADRWVKKNAKAIHILVPCYKKSTDEHTGEDTEVLRYFKAAAVFRYEETEGKELDYLQIKLPRLPLIEIAEEWGISVKAVPGNYRFAGYFKPEHKQIALATPEEKTFFHELAHASHEKVKGSIKTKQDALQEIVAELSAQALCRIVGKQEKDTTGNSYQYIERYAQEIDMSPHSACLKVIKETENVLKLILKGGTYETGNVGEETQGTLANAEHQ